MNFLKKRNKPITKVCIKNLYKSTYQGNAFTRGESYSIEEDIDKRFFSITDNENNKFQMSKEPLENFYYIGDYFGEIE